MNRIELNMKYEFIKDFCLSDKTNECEIEYLIENNKLFFCVWSDDMYRDFVIDKLSVSNLRELLAWIKRDKLYKIKKIIVKWL